MEIVPAMDYSWITHLITMLLGGSGIWILNWWLRKNKVDLDLLLVSSREAIVHKNELIASLNKAHEDERVRWFKDRDELLDRSNKSLIRIDAMQNTIFDLKEKTIQLQVSYMEIKDKLARIQGETQGP